SYPENEVTLDRHDRIFGTAGGNPTFGGLGAVFEIAPDSNGGWKHRVLYSFQFDPDGNHPRTALAMDKAQNLYGMADLGGLYGGGTVFQISHASAGQWTEKTIYDFPFVFGGTLGGLTFDKAGSLFGTAHGEVFELTRSGDNWTYTNLYTF